MLISGGGPSRDFTLILPNNRQVETDRQVETSIDR